MEQIEIKKRTPEEKAAYLQGYAAGLKRPCDKITLIFLSKTFASAEDYSYIRESLIKEKDEGVILLPPNLEYCGAVYGEADVEIIVKKVKDRLQKIRGSHETD